MKSWIWLAILPVVWVLIYENGAQVHSETTLHWAEIRCEQTTDSVTSGAACQAAVAQVHESCLRDNFTPASRYDPQSKIDRDGYWDCAAKKSSAVPPRVKTPRLRL